jgi:hypothetical protein
MKERELVEQVGVFIVPFTALSLFFSFFHEM